MNTMYIIIGITFFILGFGCGEISSTEKIIKAIAKTLKEMNKDN